jgi:hypothetical protein
MAFFVRRNLQIDGSRLDCHWLFVERNRPLCRILSLDGGVSRSDEHCGCSEYCRFDTYRAGTFSWPRHPDIFHFRDTFAFAVLFCLPAFWRQPVGTAEGNLFVVNRNLIEALALFTLLFIHEKGLWNLRAGGYFKRETKPEGLSRNREAHPVIRDAKH